jgi:hypothetical protein
MGTRFAMLTLQVRQSLAAAYVAVLLTTGCAPKLEVRGEIGAGPPRRTPTVAAAARTVRTPLSVPRSATVPTSERTDPTGGVPLGTTGVEADEPSTIASSGARWTVTRSGPTHAQAAHSPITQHETTTSWPPEQAGWWIPMVAAILVMGLVLAFAWRRRALHR